MKEFTSSGLDARILPVNSLSSKKQETTASPKTQTSKSAKLSTIDTAKPMVPRSLKHSTSKGKQLDSEYIKTLQQQIEVLELETRHLKERYEKGDFAIPTSKLEPRSKNSGLNAGSNSVDRKSELPLQDPLMALRERFNELYSRFVKETAVLKQEKEEVDGILNAAEEKIHVLQAEKQCLLDQIKTMENFNDEWKTSRISHYSKLRESHNVLVLDHQALKQAYERMLTEKSSADSQNILVEQELHEKDRVILLKDNIIEELKRQLKELFDERKEVQQERDIGLSKTNQVESLKAQVNQLQKELAAIKVTNGELSLELDIQVKKANEATERLKVAIKEGSHWKSKFTEISLEIKHSKKQVKEIRSKVTDWNEKISKRRVAVLQKVSNIRDKLAHKGSIIEFDEKFNDVNNGLATLGDNIDFLSVKKAYFDLNEIDPEWLENDVTLHYLLLYLHDQSVQLSQIDDVIIKTKAALYSHVKKASMQAEETKELAETKVLLEQRILVLEEEKFKLGEAVEKLQLRVETLQKSEVQRNKELATLQHAYKLSKVQNEKASEDKKRLEELEKVLSKVEEWKCSAIENERAAKEVAGYVHSITQTSRFTPSDKKTSSTRPMPSNVVKSESLNQALRLNSSLKNDPKGETTEILSSTHYALDSFYNSE